MAIRKTMTEETLKSTRRHAQAFFDHCGKGGPLTIEQIENHAIICLWNDCRSGEISEASIDAAVQGSSQPVLELKRSNYAK